MAVFKMGAVHDGAKLSAALRRAEAQIARLVTERRGARLERSHLRARAKDLMEAWDTSAVSGEGIRALTAAVERLRKLLP